MVIFYIKFDTTHTTRAVVTSQFEHVADKTQIYQLNSMPYVGPSKQRSEKAPAHTASGPHDHDLERSRKRSPKRMPAN